MPLDPDYVAFILCKSSTWFSFAFFGSYFIISASILLSIILSQKIMELKIIVSGDHLPTPPPIPEAIKRALEFLRSQPEDPQDGSGQGSAPKPTYKRPNKY